MIDFIKLSVKDLSLINYFRNHNLLEWISNENKFNRYDPEVINTKDKYQFKGIIFCFYTNELKISFLPHYYFNGNLHNANDFKVSDCMNIINEFKSNFKIDLEQLKIINLEFGLNVISPIAIKDLVTFLAYHNQNEFKTDNEYSFSKKSYQINKRTQKINGYKIIKAYAKGLQFPEYADINTFRFEIKSLESKYFNSLEIYTLNDLLSVTIYETLSKKLIEEFENTLILDDKTNTLNLKPKHLQELKQYQNPNYWYRIKQDNQRNKFNNEKSKYYKILDQTENHIKKQLQSIISIKLELLISSAISKPIQEIKSSAISTLYNNGIGTNNKTKTCKITGLDISMQKDSILLSHTGLRFYYHTDKNLFNAVQKKYLPKLWINSDLETQIKELAHNIRNVKYNQNTKQVRIYPMQQQNFLAQFF